MLLDDVAVPVALAGVLNLLKNPRVKRSLKLDEVGVVGGGGAVDAEVEAAAAAEDEEGSIAAAVVVVVVDDDDVADG